MTAAGSTLDNTNQTTRMDPAISRSNSPPLRYAASDAAPAAKELEIPSAKPRNEAIDVIRLIAAAGIVYVHTVHSPELIASRNLFRFAVPFYLFASLYFQSLSLRKRNDRSLWQYIAARVKRLYYPFLAWSLIYFVARDARRILEHHGRLKLQIGWLWKGVEIHLWFLPFLLASSILMAMIHWTTLRQSRKWRFPLIFLAIGAGVFFAWRNMPATWDQTFDNPTYAYVQGWRAMTAMCWGLAFAWLMTMGPAVYSISFAAGYAGILLTIFCSVKQTIAGYRLPPVSASDPQSMGGIELVPRALSGLGGMVAALAPWTGSLVPVLARFGRYSYGIYLCHVLVAECVRLAVSRTHLPDSPALDMVAFLSTFAGSMLVVVTLGRSPRTAWLNG